MSDYTAEDVFMAGFFDELEKGAGYNEDMPVLSKLAANLDGGEYEGELEGLTLLEQLALEKYAGERTDWLKGKGEAAGKAVGRAGGATLGALGRAGSATGRFIGRRGLQIGRALDLLLDTAAGSAGGTGAKGLKERLLGAKGQRGKVWGARGGTAAALAAGGTAAALLARRKKKKGARR